MCLCNTNTYCVHNMFKYTKSSEVNPQKNKDIKIVQAFSSPLGQFSKKSQEKVSVESRMLGKKEKMWHCLPFAAETRGSNAMSLHCPNSFQQCGTESYWGSYKPTGRCSNQSTNSRKKKHRHLCPGIADANWTQQKVCKSHSSDRNLIQCFQCSTVSVKLFPCMPCRHSGEWRFSSTHTHTLNLSTTVDGHEWSASCQATPIPTEQEAGREPELALGTLE